MREHNPPKAKDRSFIAPNDKERIESITAKLDLRPDYVKGKIAIVNEDTLVRANTLKTLNKILRDAGVEKIINTISAPPISNICNLGIEMTTQDQLIACLCEGDINEIRKKIRSDVLIYNSNEGLRETVKKVYNSGICG